MPKGRRSHSYPAENPPNPRLLREQPFLLCDGAKKVGLTHWILRRAIKYGKTSLSGRTVYLEWILLTGGKGTSAAAVDRFLSAIND
jgi:hypothetical protein